MIFITYSDSNESNIRTKLGLAEYSYYFVRQSFTPLLEQLGIVVNVTDPEAEVDPIYRFCQSIEEDCVFLSFCPPHKIFLDLECPTIPVFAWEFADIPHQVWSEDLRNDWQIVLRRLGCAITHSRFARDAVTRYMGQEFPVIDLPSPVWDRFNQARPASSQPVKSFSLHLDENGFTDIQGLGNTNKNAPETEISQSGQASESISSVVTIEFSMDELTQQNKTKAETPAPPGVMKDVQVDGVVYTSIFNPFDGRKNWEDTLKAFCLAHENNPDAVLILKMATVSPDSAKTVLWRNLRKMPKFKCRVLVIYDHLSFSNYITLAQNTSFIVNTSHGEGQCLPLMEFMSMGIPAIAPNHSSMRDYISQHNAFIIESSREPAAWPHDPRQKMMTFRYRVNFETIMDAFQKSYAMAWNDTDCYEEMSKHATESLQAHCCEANFLSTIRDLLESRKFIIQPNKQYDWNAYMKKNNISVQDGTA